VSRRLGREESKRPSQFGAGGDGGGWNEQDFPEKEACSRHSLPVCQAGRSRAVRLLKGGLLLHREVGGLLRRLFMRMRVLVTDISR
jgi:hypothetical protein